MIPKLEILSTHLHKYSKSLSAYPENYLKLFFSSEDNIPPIHYAYICPICTKQGVILYDKEFIVSTKTELTIDHFPPESVGGTEKVLVCRTCNSKAGANYEHVITQKMAEMAFNSKTTSAVSNVKSEISNLKGRYSSRINVGVNGELIISFKPNDKAHTPLLDQWLEQSTKNLDWTAEITIPISDTKKVSKGLLKTAYLFCFESWGYEFVFSNTGSMIRNILNSDDEYPLENPSFWLGETVKNGQLKSLPIGVCYLEKPLGWKLFVINIVLKDLDTEYENVVSVLIPGPHLENWKDLTDIKQILDSRKEITLTMAHVTEYLLCYGVIDGYTKNWNVIRNKET